MMEQTKKISAFRMFRGDFQPTPIYLPKYIVDAMQYLHNCCVENNLYHDSFEKFYTKIFMVGLELVLTDFEKLLHHPNEDEILALAAYSLREEVEQKLQEQLERKNLFE